MPQPTSIPDAERLRLGEGNSATSSNPVVCKKGPHMKALKPYLRRRRLGALASAHQVSYTPDQVAALYQFPKVPAGPEQTIAIIELGGGFVPADIHAYFTKLQLPTPNVSAIMVNGGANAPGQDEDADGEVMLDILVAAAAYSYCTGSAANIAVFFAPNNNTGFAAAIKAAAAHPAKPSVCSISWGGPENRWSAADRAGMESALTSAAHANMTVLAAAGDNGSGDGEIGHHVDYPASSPQVIGCGGTSLHAAQGAITAESAWHDGSRGGATGGGFSANFPKPAWQVGNTNQARGVPDLAGNADPYTGYVVIVDGQQQVIGGTSAVAPLMSALIAVLCRAKSKRFGFIIPQLYKTPSAFRDITVGNNGAFAASTGWDPTTGLGVPSGGKLLDAVA
jgi:kumamolisin